VGDRRDDNVLFEIWRLSRVATRAIDDTIRGSGLTADEFAVYSVLSAGPRTPGELAEWLAAPPTTVSSYIQRFERRGHVHREPSTEDGRSYQVALTPAGRAAHTRAGTAFLTLLDDVRAGLGPTEDQVHQAIRDLRTVLATRAGSRRVPAHQARPPANDTPRAEPTRG
jgi:DNA-binding MarR family transcriptional regulator